MADPTSPQVNTFEENREAIVTLWQSSTYGPNSNTSSDTVDGNIIDLLTTLDTRLAETRIRARASCRFLESVDGELDALVGPLLGTERGQARGSTASVVVYGDPGAAILAGAQVSTSQGDIYLINNAVQIPTSSTFSAFLFSSSVNITQTTITIGGDVFVSPPTLGTGRDIAVAQHSVLNVTGDIVAFSDPFEDSAGNGVIIIETQVIVATSVSATASDVVRHIGTLAAVTSEALGAVSGEALTINKINSTLPGWVGVVNLQSVNVGKIVDTDAQYRARHLLTRAKTGCGTLIALRSVLNDESEGHGIEASIVYHNDSGMIDAQGRPTGVIEAIVVGGDPTVFGPLIYREKGAGVGTFGSSSITFVDSADNANHLVRYSNAVELFMWITVDIEAGEGFPTISLSDIQTSIQQSFTEFGKTLGIGRDVLIADLCAQVGIPGIKTLTISMGSTFTPTASPPPVVAGNFNIEYNEISRYLESRITVNVTGAI